MNSNTWTKLVSGLFLTAVLIGAPLAAQAAQGGAYPMVAADESHMAYAPTQRAVQGDGTLPLADVSLGGLTIGMTPEAVEYTYGAPTKVIHSNFTSQNNSMRYYYDPYGNVKRRFSVGFHMGTIESVYTFTRDLATPAGLMVGDPAVRTLQLYGRPARDVVQGNIRYLTYTAKEDSRVQLIVLVANDKVAEICITDVPQG